MNDSPSPVPGSPDDPAVWVAWAASAPLPVVISSRRWAAAGVLVLLTALGAWIIAFNDIVGLVLGVLGTVLILMARNQRFGQDNRTALTVVGSMSCFTFWPMSRVGHVSSGCGWRCAALHVRRARWCVRDRSSIFWCRSSSGGRGQSKPSVVERIFEA